MIKIEPEFNFLAIYFRMGQYNEDDKVASQLLGFDCPFDDSPVLYAVSEEDLERRVQEVYVGKVGPQREWAGVDWRGIYPDVISDQRGSIRVEVQRRICHDQEFDPTKVKYSLGRETLAELWEREKWRWINKK